MAFSPRAVVVFAKLQFFAAWFQMAMPVKELWKKDVEIFGGPKSPERKTLR
jgi:hypothetical protein